MRTLKYSYAFIALILLLGCAPRRVYAQFLGYTSPQTVQQTLAAAGTACTGSAQTFNVQNLGQTQHYASIVPAGSIATLSMFIQGRDTSGNLFTISDTVFSGATFGFTPTVAGTGYFPIVSVVVTCSGGMFTLSYTGTSAASNVASGSYLGGSIDKAVFQFAAQNASIISPLFTPPFGTSAGKIIFAYNTAGLAGSNVQVKCFTGATATSYVAFNYPPANATGLQVFQVPGATCQQITVGYTSGGASANTFSMDYLFDPPGTNSVTTSALSLGAAQNIGAWISEKGARWGAQTSSPAAGSQATTSKAAGAAGVRHVADCVTWSAGGVTAPAAAAQLVINLRDGATGAGTILWQSTIVAPAAIGQHGSGQLCGLNLIGTAATAMTLEFSAALGNESESVALTGYDVQ
jgi:hypothetical protein